MTAPRIATDRVGLALAAGLAALGLLGIAVVVLGQWRPSPGGNPWLVPLLAFLTLLPTAGLMARSALKGRVGPALPRPDVLPIVLGALWATGFFVLVRALGLVSATLLSMLLAMWVLAPRPRPVVRILVLTAVVALVFWLLFTRLAPLVLSTPWLF